MGVSRDTNGGVAVRSFASHGSSLFLVFISEKFIKGVLELGAESWRRPNTTQRKLTLTAKSAKSDEIESVRDGQANMVDKTPLLSRGEVDSLVERITAEVLKGMEASFDKKINPVLKKLAKCSSMVTALDTWISKAESHFSDCEDAMTTHIAKFAKTESKLEAALEIIDDLENRGRRCNIRIIGLPEGSEGSNPMSFFKTWLPELLQLSFKGGAVKLDHCHRALTGRPLPRQRPRAVIIWLHNFQDKVQIMQAARKTQALSYNDTQIMTSEDFSAAVIKKRQEFFSVKQQLKERGIVFIMLYPAVLRIRHDGKERFFKEPKDAAAFLECLSQPEELSSPASDV